MIRNFKEYKFKICITIPETSRVVQIAETEFFASNDESAYQIALKFVEQLIIKLEIKPEEKLSMDAHTIGFYRHYDDLQRAIR